MPLSALTSEVSAASLTTYMMAAPDATEADGKVAAPFEFTQVPDDDTIASGGGAAPFTTKHLLTMTTPLPAALMTYVVSSGRFPTSRRPSLHDAAAASSDAVRG